MPGQTNPVRDAVRAEILEALSGGQSFMSHELYSLCQSAVDPKDVARVAHELVKKGLLVNGEKAAHPLGMSANTYRLPTAEDPRIAAAKPIKVERKIPRTIKPPKPAPDHPFKARIVAQEAHDGAPRVTRPLPMHLQSTAPRDAFPAVSPVAQTTTAPYHHILETAMSEDPLQYIPDPDAFTLEPKDPEAEEDIDSDLVDALMGLAHMKVIEADSADELLAKMVPLPMAKDDDVGDMNVLHDAWGRVGTPPELTDQAFHLTGDQEPKDQAVDDVLAMASADVGEIAAAMGKRQDEAHKVCQCLRINSLPPLPKGYIYGGIKVWIESEHDMGRLTIATHDEGGGAFASIKASGRLSFDPGDLVAIGQVADALIKLHESMDKQNID